MALRKFLFGFNSAEYKKFQILFVNGEKAGLISNDTLDMMYKSLERLFFIRVMSIGVCGTFSYMVPIPLDFLFMVGAKVMIFSISHRGLTFMAKMDYLDKLKATCEKNALYEKIELMDIPMSDKIFLKGFEKKQEMNEKES